jgi:hypothetical protein
LAAFAQTRVVREICPIMFLEELHTVDLVRPQWGLYGGFE